MTIMDLEEKVLLGIFVGAIAFGIGSSFVASRPDAAGETITLAKALDEPIETVTFIYKRRPAECLADVIAPEHQAMCAAHEAQAPRIEQREGAPDSAFAGKAQLPPETAN